jgi:hypothetical protein
MYWSLVLTLVTSSGVGMTTVPIFGTQKTCADEGARWSKSMDDIRDMMIYKRSYHCMPAPATATK